MSFLKWAFGGAKKKCFSLKSKGYSRMSPSSDQVYCFMQCEKKDGFCGEQRVPRELVLLYYHSLQRSIFPEIMSWNEFTSSYWFFFHCVSEQKGLCHSKYKMHLKKYSSVKPNRIKVRHPQERPSHKRASHAKGQVK